MLAKGYGYYVVVGDKTTCGGTVVEGFPDNTLFGQSQSCETHRVTCGQHPGEYFIVGGTGDKVHGRQMAGSLHSQSSCPCRARFIPSIMNHIYELTVPTEDEPQQFAQSAKKQNRDGVDAGFCVVPHKTSVSEFETQLFISPSEGTQELYRSLNGAGQIKAGSILLVVDPNKQDAHQIESLKKAKVRVDTALSTLTDDEANFMHKHYATIANLSSIADKGIGLAADSAGKYFEQIEKILNKIHATYKNQYITKGTLIGEQFFVERRLLFKELDTLMKNGFLGKTMKLGEYTKIKNALGLSSSAIMHKWNKNGVSDIEGYATHIERSARLIKAMRYTGYAAIGFSAMHSINEVNEACSVGRENECTRKKYTETGSFIGGTSGGIAGGFAGGAVCAVVGVPTMGTGALVCAIVLAGVGGYIGSELGGSGGEKLGDIIYSVVEE